MITGISNTLSTPTQGVTYPIPPLSNEKANLIAKRNFLSQADYPPKGDYWANKQVTAIKDYFLAPLSIIKTILSAQFRFLHN